MYIYIYTKSIYAIYIYIVFVYGICMPNSLFCVGAAAADA